MSVNESRPLLQWMIPNKISVCIVLWPTCFEAFTNALNSVVKVLLYMVHRAIEKTCQSFVKVLPSLYIYYILINNSNFCQKQNLTKWEEYRQWYKNSTLITFYRLNVLLFLKNFVGDRQKIRFVLPFYKLFLYIHLVKLNIYITCSSLSYL